MLVVAITASSHKAVIGRTINLERTSSFVNSKKLLDTPVRLGVQTQNKILRDYEIDDPVHMFSLAGHEYISRSINHCVCLHGSHGVYTMLVRPSVTFAMLHPPGCAMSWHAQATTRVRISMVVSFIIWSRPPAACGGEGEITCTSTQVRKEQYQQNTHVHANLTHRRNTSKLWLA